MNPTVNTILIIVFFLFYVMALLKFIQSPSKFFSKEMYFDPRGASDMLVLVLGTFALVFEIVSRI